MGLKVIPLIKFCPHSHATSAVVQVVTFADEFVLEKRKMGKCNTLGLEVAKKYLEGVETLWTPEVQHGKITHSSFTPSNLYYGGKTKGKMLIALLEDVIQGYNDLGM